MPRFIARSISNLTDARYFAAREVSHLIFELSPELPAYLDPSHMQAMREWVEGPLIAGEFADGTPAEVVREAAKFYPLNAVVVGPDIDFSTLEALDFWVRLPADATHVADFLSKNAARSYTFLLEPLAHTTDWPALATWLRPYAQQHRILLQYDAEAAHINVVLSHDFAYAIVLRGGDEEQVGIKSFDEIEAIFEAVEANETVTKSDF
jgi:phosphoribosylanthranilate isomerase